MIISSSQGRESRTSERSRVSIFAPIFERSR